MQDASELFKSYLNEHTQTVSMNGVVSGVETTNFVYLRGLFYGIFY